MAVETHCKLRKAGGSMVENNRLPDTPWHVGYAKKQEDDPRRHMLFTNQASGTRMRT